MKRIAFFAILVSLSLAVLEAAELRSTIGNVEVQRAGSSVWTQGRPKTEVGPGDVVRTGAGSQTDIQMKEGHKMTLRERTSLKVDASQAGDNRFNLLVGRMRTFVSKLKGQDKFEVKTPVAVASIRGTIFDMEVLENQTSRLSVLEGVVSYRDLAGIGQEVQVLKGQSVVVEPGAGPRPPEPLPADMQQGLVPTQSQQAAAFGLKAEIQREVGLASFKEFFQVDAAEEMKRAQYQEGKTVIDAFGKRVRLEEYISRPDPKQWSFVALNTREDRSDFTRFDLYANADLPEDISTVNLFSSNGTMTNWLVKTHRLTSNGGDYYREWQDGGAPVNVTGGQKVFFDHWFVEIRPEGQDPILLSHWVKDVGNTNSGVPSGYKNFGTGTVGDARPIDSAGFTGAQRLDYFKNASVAASYAASEGFSRSQSALFNDNASVTVDSLLGATKVSTLTTYTVPGGTDITLRNDEYYLSDQGDKLSVLEKSGHTRAEILSNTSLVNRVRDGANIESALTSSRFGGRKIDVVISPSIFKKAGLLDN